MSKIPTSQEFLVPNRNSLAANREYGAVDFFQRVAAHVPAYADFLSEAGINPLHIRTAADLALVPPIDKKNYLRKYPLEQLCWDGTLSGKAFTYTSTSGSTGEPFYFPRDLALDRRAALMHEMFLKNVSGDHIPTTLIIVTFGMGVWIGGLITYQAFRHLAEQGYPVSVFTPGMNKKEIFRILSQLAPKYEQVVVCGYPPFVKDLLDEAVTSGISPHARMKLLFAAEGFSETFREHVLGLAGAKDPVFDTANVYGSADLGTMAIETPVSIAVRRAAIAHPQLYKALFSNATRLPTLAQFHPELCNFEERDGQVLVSGDSALPLVRYAIGDSGGVLEYDEVMDKISSIDKVAHASLLAIVGDNAMPLPFVYVYERNDFSVSLYGLMIYAEHMRASLQSKNLADQVTGKFSMSTERDAQENQYLDLRVELRKNVPASDELRESVVTAAVDGLLLRNSEYTHLLEKLGERAKPRVTLEEHESLPYFAPGTKQRWIR